MARALRIEYAGAFYHVMSRGNERKAVFESPPDRERFLSYLESATERYGAIVHAYCLMHNHYHLLLETPSGNLSRIMQHINGAYSSYFNRVRGRSGHLFQGRYKAILIEADEYAMEVSRYIHLNPVRSGKVVNPEEYRWSSCRFYTIRRKAPVWLHRNIILSYFDRRLTVAMKMYRRFVSSSVNGENEIRLAKVSHSVILGSETFVAGIKNRFLRARSPDRELPGVRHLTDRPELGCIDQVVDSCLQADEKLARQVKLHLWHRYSGRGLKEIGERFGVTESGVSQASRRIRIRQEDDRKLRLLVSKIVKEASLSNL